MPLLLQGLDALSRHVDKTTGTQTLGNRERFNPLVWLAQYLLRNHPRYVKDHRSGMYQSFAELASIERGRRCLLRRQSQMEEEWQDMVKENAGDPLSLDDISVLFTRLDSKWYLEGALLEKIPKEFENVIQLPQGETEVTFADFWRWFEEFVRSNDILRAQAFLDASRRQWELEQKAKQMEEEAARREKAMEEAMQQRALLEEQFETITADMYINDQITRIMNKGAVILGVEEKEDGPPLQGEHITLIRMMMSIWGCPVTASDAPEDVWNDATFASWQHWLKMNNLASGGPKVDSYNLRFLMDKDAFQEYLEKAYPVRDVGDEDYMRSVVEIRDFIEDEVDIIVEAVDEDTGDILNLSLPEAQVAELKERLAAGGTIHASVDRISARIMELLPPGSDPTLDS